MFDLARIASHQSPLHYRVGAVIVNHGTPISFGFNQNRTHPKYANGENAYSIHAEVTAMIRARSEIRGSSIYVYREDRNGTPCLAKPCPTCTSILIEAGIKRVYYTTGVLWKHGIRALTWNIIDL